MSSRSKGANLPTELNVLTQLGVVGNLPDSELLGRFLAHKGRAGGDPSGSADRNGSGVIRIRGKTGDGGQSVISRRGRPRQGSRLRHDDLQLKAVGAAVLVSPHAGWLTVSRSPFGKPGGTSRTVQAGVAAETRTIKVIVVDADGKPTQGAHVFRNHVYQPDGTDKPKIENQDYLTDADGKALIRLSGTSVDLRLWVRKTGFVPSHAMWAKQFQSDGDQVPEEFTFRLTRGTEIGGVVVDEKAAPIEGVKIEVKDQTAGRFHLIPVPKKPGQRPVRDVSLAEGEQAVVTDMRGHWRLGNVPPDEDLIFVSRVPAGNLFGPPEPPLEIVLHLSHPDYISNEVGWGELQRSQGVTLKSLRELTARIVLRRK